MGEVYISQGGAAFRVEPTHVDGHPVVSVRGRESVDEGGHVVETLCGELDHPEALDIPVPLLSDLAVLFGGLSLPADITEACERSVEAEDALHEMSVASLGAIQRELHRHTDRFVGEAGRLEESYVAVCDAVDEFYRSSSPDIDSNEVSLRNVQSELHALAQRQQKELRVAYIVDSDWWREVVR